MRKVLTLLIALLPLSLLAQINWDKTICDLVTINEDNGSVSQKFSFQNIGNKPITIKQVRTTCGCTTSRYPKTAINPGDSASIVATYNPIGRPGGFEKTLKVVTSDTIYRLTITGRVIPSQITIDSHFPASIGKLRLSASKVIFNDVESGKNRSTWLYGYNTTQDTIVASFNNLPPLCSVSISPDTIPPGSTFNIAAIFRTTREFEYGRHVNIGTFCQNGEEFPLEMICTVIASRGEVIANAPKCTFADNCIRFEDYRKREFSTSVLVIKNDGESDLKIKGFATGDEAVFCECTFPVIIAPGKESQLEFQLDRENEKNYIINDELIIYTNDPYDPNKTVRLVGNK